MITPIESEQYTLRPIKIDDSDQIRSAVFNHIPAVTPDLPELPKILGTREDAQEFTTDLAERTADEDEAFEAIVAIDNASNQVEGLGTWEVLRKRAQLALRANGIMYAFNGPQLQPAGAAMIKQWTTKEDSKLTELLFRRLQLQLALGDRADRLHRASGYGTNFANITLVRAGDRTTQVAAEDAGYRKPQMSSLIDEVFDMAGGLTPTDDYEVGPATLRLAGLTDGVRARRLVYASTMPIYDVDKRLG